MGQGQRIPICVAHPLPEAAKFIGQVMSVLLSRKRDLVVQR